MYPLKTNVPKFSCNGRESTGPNLYPLTKGKGGKSETQMLETIWGKGSCRCTLHLGRIEYREGPLDQKVCTTIGIREDLVKRDPGSQKNKGQEFQSEEDENEFPRADGPWMPPPTYKKQLPGETKGLGKGGGGRKGTGRKGLLAHYGQGVC